MRAVAWASPGAEALSVMVSSPCSIWLLATVIGTDTEETPLGMVTEEGREMLPGRDEESETDNGCNSSPERVSVPKITPDPLMVEGGAVNVSWDDWLLKTWMDAAPGVQFATLASTVAAWNPLIWLLGTRVMLKRPLFLPLGITAVGGTLSRLVSRDSSWTVILAAATLGIETTPALPMTPSPVVPVAGKVTLRRVDRSSMMATDVWPAE